MPRAPRRSTRRSPTTRSSRLEIDALGLDAMDRRYLTMIADLYGGGPVGVETLAAGLSEPRDTIEDVIEPFLIQLGLIARTARGRCLNGRGWTHLGLPQPQEARLDCSTGADPSDSLFIAGLLQRCLPRRQHRSQRSPSRWITRPSATGYACRAAPTSARRRWRPRRSIPTAMARPAAAWCKASAPIDCFYVYPTVSRDRGPQQRPHCRERRAAVAETQFARFASVCRPFAPIYRQMTLARSPLYATGADVSAAGGLAYADVAAAWRNYRRDAQQRPPVRAHRP